MVYYTATWGDIPLKGSEKSAVRQIAHEVLKSLNPALLDMKLRVEGTLVTGEYAVVEEKQPVVPKVGRSEPCPCESGGKYKMCHESLPWLFCPNAITNSLIGISSPLV